MVLCLAITPISAHEGRELEGDISVEFGWRNEPAYAGLLNGIEMFVHNHATEEPIEGAELRVEVSYGGESMTVLLSPVAEDPGHYVADLIPTIPGDYSFHVTGTVGDVQLDTVFTSADGQFGTVEPGADIMFPKAGIADTAALLARIAALEARIAELEAKAGS
jgi:hypothetical protein